LNCGSDKTYLRKGKYEYEQWYKYKDGFICQNCYNKLILDPKWNKIKAAKNNPRKMRFTPLGTKISLKENPRKGVCEWCGKKIGDEYIDYYGKVAVVDRTAIHHFAEYHLEDPLKDTVELCPSCHAKESVRLRRLKQ